MHPGQLNSPNYSNFRLASYLEVEQFDSPSLGNNLSPTKLIQPYSIKVVYIRRTIEL